jgi:hypothetical protein
MEGQIAERLRNISASRNKLIDHLIIKLPPTIESSTLFHSLVLFSTVTVLVSVYAQLRSLTLFSMHPTCMTIGSFIFLAEGIVSFRNRSLVETLSPIMSHNKKTKVRHQFFLIGVLYAFLVLSHFRSPAALHVCRSVPKFASKCANYRGLLHLPRGSLHISA